MIRKSGFDCDDIKSYAKVVKEAFYAAELLSHDLRHRLGLTFCVF